MMLLQASGAPSVLAALEWRPRRNILKALYAVLPLALLDADGCHNRTGPQGDRHEPE